MDRTRVVITGLGWITPLGRGLEGVWKRLLAGESGVDRTTLFDATTFPTTFSAEVAPFELADFLGPDAAKAHAGASRNTVFALAAAKMAWEDAGLASAPTLDRTRLGIYLGGGEGPLDFPSVARAGIAGCDRAGGAAPGSFFPDKWAAVAYEAFSAVGEFEQDPNMAGAHLACLFDARGPNLDTLTACAASTQAIGEAREWIRRGEVDVMISGGTHSMIHPLGVTGFNRLTALSKHNQNPRGASRPFDRSRDGFVLGEGAGIVILESLEHARSRGAKVWAEVAGYGSTADAFRVTDIHEDARGSASAMRLALQDAGMGPEDIDYISAHGTGTKENDSIETLAIRLVFGARATLTPISSVKSMLGHLIAAAGAVELITCILAIRDGFVPPTINYQNPDPACDLDYVPNEARRTTVRAALSNSFGFGGQNDTLIVKRLD